MGALDLAGDPELQQMRSATHERDPNCVTCVSNLTVDYLLDNSKNQCHSLALALPLNLKSRALFFPGDWCWILNGRSYRRDDG